jgi:hypothetical protein
MKNSFNLSLGFNLIKELLNLKNNYIKSSTIYKGLCQGLFNKEFFMIRKFTS